MDSTRRKFLRMSVVTAASMALPVGALAQQKLKSVASSFSPTGDEYGALSYLTAADFKPSVGAIFKAQSASGTLRLTLVEVQDPPTLPGSTGQPMYALRFQGSGKSQPQGTYIFRNSAFPPFAMFVVPSGSKTPFYTGLVNHSAQ